MANMSLADFSDLINQQIESRQLLSNQLGKAEALSNIAVCNNFLDNSSVIIHDYLLALSDIIEDSKQINDKDLCHLFKKLSFYLNNEGITSD